MPIPDFQGNAVVNYTDKETPFTRIIEHKHFEFGNQPVTVVTKEFPAEWTVEKEPYYPINDDSNSNLYKQYRELSLLEEDVIFGGRLAEYKYYDMHHVIAHALKRVKVELENTK
jgi:UDP-galactopyranose mutase